MPNHTLNRVSFTGPGAQDIKPLLEGDERPLDFNKLIPMPKELDVESNSTAQMFYEIITDGDWQRILHYPWVVSEGIKTKDELREFLRRRFGDEQERIAYRYASNKERFGHTTWYDWSIANWGTKWNAYDQELVEDHPVEYSFVFYTAWAPPDPIIDRMAELARERGLGFFHEYALEDDGYEELHVMYDFEAGEENADQ